VKANGFSTRFAASGPLAASEIRRRIAPYAEEASEAGNAVWRCLAKPGC